VNNSDKNMGQQDLKKRTKEFALRVIRLVQFLNEHGPVAAKIIANSQLLRSGTGVAAGYRAACRSKSRKDFISKLGTVVEEVDETHLWLELLLESRMIDSYRITNLLVEAGELTAIMTSSRNSAIMNQEREN
jgi:four helix bundle protein